MCVYRQEQEGEESSSVAQGKERRRDARIQRDRKGQSHGQKRRDARISEPVLENVLETAAHIYGTHVVPTAQRY